MKKEEILEKSRKENKNKDIAKIDTLNNASRIAAIAGSILCVFISILDWHITKTINYACWTVNFGILSTLFTIKYIRLRQKHELTITIVYVLFFAFFCYGYIFNLVSTAI